MLVIVNKPPCIPIPLVKTVKEVVSFKIQYDKINIAILLYKIDKSRLEVTALDNSKDKIDNISIYKYKLEKRIELLLLMYEINVLTVKLFKLVNLELYT